MNILKRIKYFIYCVTIGVEHKLIDMENEKLSKRPSVIVCVAFKNGNPIYRAGDPSKAGKKFKEYANL